VHLDRDAVGQFDAMLGTARDQLGEHRNPLQQGSDVPEDGPRLVTIRCNHGERAALSRRQDLPVVAKKGQVHGHERCDSALAAAASCDEPCLPGWRV